MLANQVWVIERTGLYSWKLLTKAQKNSFEHLEQPFKCFFNVIHSDNLANAVVSVNAVVRAALLMQSRTPLIQRCVSKLQHQAKTKIWATE